MCFTDTTGPAMNILLQVGITTQIGKPVIHQAGLTRTKHFTRPAYFQILLGNIKTIITAAHYGQAFLTQFR